MKLELFFSNSFNTVLKAFDNKFGFCFLFEKNVSRNTFLFEFPTTMIVDNWQIIIFSGFKAIKKLPLITISVSNLELNEIIAILKFAELKNLNYLKTMVWMVSSDTKSLKKS